MILKKENQIFLFYIKSLQKGSSQGIIKDPILKYEKIPPKNENKHFIISSQYMKI